MPTKETIDPAMRAGLCLTIFLSFTLQIVIQLAWTRECFKLYARTLLSFGYRVLCLATCLQQEGGLQQWLDMAYSLMCELMHMAAVVYGQFYQLILRQSLRILQVLVWFPVRVHACVHVLVHTYSYVHTYVWESVLPLASYQRNSVLAALVCSYVSFCM